MKITVGLRRKSGVNSASVSVACNILFYDILDEPTELDSFLIHSHVTSVSYQ